MTPDEFRKWWAAATPRERDAKVAELVMGWTLTDVYSVTSDEVAEYMAHRTKAGRDETTREWSSGKRIKDWQPTADTREGIADAWEVWDAMKANYWRLLRDETGRTYRVLFVARGNKQAQFTANQPDEKLAICLAACLAKIEE